MECNMPTSVSEATNICEIINKFLSLEDAREVTSRLYEEVGQTTNNQSLKISLEMLRDLYA
jgi:hypothetical protein